MCHMVVNLNSYMAADKECYNGQRSKYQCLQSLQGLNTLHVLVIVIGHHTWLLTCV